MRVLTKSTLSSYLVVEFLEVEVPGYLVNVALELTFTRQQGSAHQYAGHKTYFFFESSRPKTLFRICKWFNTSRIESSDGYEVSGVVS